MAKRKATVLKIESFKKTVFANAVDCTITVIVRPGALPEVLPYTYTTGDRSDVSLAIRDWLDKHKVDPFAEAADVDFSAEIVEGIKREAGRRIRLLMPRVAIERELTGGKPVPQETRDAVAAVRRRSNELEQLNPLPQDFAADKYWI